MDQLHNLCTQYFQHKHLISCLVLYTPCFRKKTGLFVISSYLCYESYKLHENFQKYLGDIACCEYGINIYDSLAILC